MPLSNCEADVLEWLEWVVGMVPAFSRVGLRVARRLVPRFVIHLCGTYLWYFSAVVLL